MKVHKSSKGYEYIVPTATVVLPILLALPVQYSLPSHYRCYSYYQPQPPPTWSKAWLIAQWRLQIPDWTCSISFCSGSLPVCIGLFQRGQHPPQVQDVGFQLSTTACLGLGTAVADEEGGVEVTVGGTEAIATERTGPILRRVPQ